MSEIKKFLHGKRHRNISYELMIKNNSKKLEKVKVDFIKENRNISIETLEDIIFRNIELQKSASSEECINKGFKHELNVRKSYSSIQVAISKQCKKNKFQKNYFIADEKLHRQTMEISELKQKIEIIGNLDVI